MAQKVPRLERFMCRLARFQIRYFVPMIIFFLSLTSLLALGLPNVRIQSDFTKFLPQDLPVVMFDQRISETFGASDTVFVLARLDKSCAQSTFCVKDIRDPRVIRMMVELEQTLPGKTGVDRVFSAGTFFPDTASIPGNLDGTRFVFSQIPGSENVFNRDFSATIITIEGSVGGEQQKKIQFSQSIEDELETVETPPGVILTVTGVPQLEAEIFRLLELDAVNVTLYAGILIMILLLILLRSPLRTFQTFTPVLFSLVWTLGLMGWSDVELSVATVAAGAFIIGLGIEYGIFFVKRFEEGLKDGLSSDESIEGAVCGIGSAITSSATTTSIGFLMLALTILPIIQVLGVTMALSILFSLVGALLINPPLIIAEERLVSGFRKWRSNNG
jgi:hydrophobe/amphiphile efflux-3 (HAE3) family protein